MSIISFGLATRHTRQTGAPRARRYCVQHNNYNYKNALDVLGFTLGQGDDLLAGGVVSRAAHNQNYPSPNAAHSRYNEL